MGEGAIDLGIAGLGPAIPFARGGFATVYRAEQLSLRRSVAVKVLFSPPRDQVAFSRFERECHSLAAASNHPNIVVVHDRGVTADGRPYLIMEYRPGGSLADVLLADGPFSPDRVRDVGIKICEALAVAHEAGVIHRDVKPGNILLSAHGEPALADFGIARIDGGHKTTTGQISASVAHAAREVLAGEEPSVQSDVYSLGSTLLELGTGRTPYHRDGDSTVWQLINRIMHEPPIDAADVGLPGSLAAAVNRALDPDLACRFANARDFQAALHNVKPGGGSGVVDPGATVRYDPDEALQERRPVTQPIMGRGRRHIPRLVTGVLAIAGLIAIAVAALLTKGFGLVAATAPQAELEFSQALVEPLATGRTYALGIRNAAPDATFQLLVDDEPVGEPTDNIVVYESEAGRHQIAVEVTDPAGSTESTEPVEIYVSPGPPVGGYRVNLAAVRIAPARWPTALERFDELLAEGHEELVLSVGASDEFWVFYIDGFGDDADAAWAYCQRFELEQEDCFAAEVPVEDE